jgi:hypothetical protein
VDGREDSETWVASQGEEAVVSIVREDRKEGKITESTHGYCACLENRIQ